MKKLLIGTSAIVAMGALPAAAMAEAPTLKISGALDAVYSVAGSSDGTQDGDGLGAGNSGTQLIFDWVGSADNGLGYGARLDYRFQSNTTDELYAFLSGGWGRLHVGGDDGVIDNNVPGGESVLAGDYGFDGNNQALIQTGAATVTATLASSTDDAMKFSYYSPSFAGFSAGLSYIPNRGQAGPATGANIDGDGQFEGTLAYSGSFDAVGLSAGIGYAYGQGDDQQEDIEGLMTGATISFAGFSAGVGYGDNFDTGCPVNANCEGSYWLNFGLAYSFGPGNVSLGYAMSEVDPDGLGEDESDWVGIDADYTIAEGLKAVAGVNAFWSEDASAGNQEDGQQALVGLVVSF